MQYSLKHTISTDLDTFWSRLFFEPEFNQALHLGQLQYAKYVVLEDRTTPDGTRHRRVECVPKVDMPGPVRKLFGEGVGYTEVGRFDPVARRYHLDVVPSLGGDKLKTSTEISAEALGAKSIARIASGEATVKVFGLGSLIEGLIEKQAREMQDKSAEFMNRWIAERGL